MAFSKAGPEVDAIVASHRLFRAGLIACLLFLPIPETSAGSGSLAADGEAGLGSHRASGSGKKGLKPLACARRDHFRVKKDARAVPVHAQVKKDFDQLREDYEDSRKAVHILNEADLQPRPVKDQKACKANARADFPCFVCHQRQLVCVCVDYDLCVCVDLCVLELTCGSARYGNKSGLLGFSLHFSVKLPRRGSSILMQKRSVSAEMWPTVECSACSNG